MRTARIDSLSTRIDFDAPAPTPGNASATYTEEGYLVVDAYLARDGLLVYSDGKTQWREYRPADELRKAADTFRYKPITDDHPQSMVNAANVLEHMKGVVLDDVRTETLGGVTYLRGSLKVMDEGLIKKIQDGQRELSIGMWARVEVRDGEYRGEAFSAVQRDCEGNHLASVQRGRAGSAVRVFLDGAQIPVHNGGQIIMSNPETESPRADEVGTPTTEAKLVGPDGTELMVPTWLAAMVEDYRAMKAAEAEMAMPPAEPEEEPPAEPAEEPAEEPMVEDEDEDEVEDEKDKMMDTVKELVARRVRLERFAIKADVPSEDLSDEDLARALVAKAAPRLKERADQASGEVLDALVDIASDELKTEEPKNTFERPTPVVKNDSADARKAAALRKTLGIK